ncbi:hypothetical protein OG455_18340 [Kitasatospora sp. NBC_01287]|uniref:hypothetical protein n=1 Tax=Kitasatospora sp. NBC_01287 TaxID=2903573 RepID=UPI00225B60C1|nr:hypothetical protein [Kitasatospora sp. NBC_01287]MCX4747455.1 hypothetical protein [Kitasatospora sp. NBC_01287]
MDQEDLRLAPRPHTAELLRWAQEQGLEPVPAAAVDAVLTLLELGDAQLREGFPVLTSDLLQELLYERIHLYVQPPAEQSPLAYGAAVRLLIDHQRAAKRLNAKRQQRLREEADWQGELLAGLLRQPHLLTWPRLYTLLLREAGVAAAGPDAVRAWLDGFRALPEQDRIEAFAQLADLDQPEGAAGWTEGVLLSIGMATDGARLLVENRLMQRSYRNLAGRTALGLPMPPELAGDFPAFEAAVQAEALRLLGEWTVPGLPALLLTEYQDLAPEPGAAEVDGYIVKRGLVDLPDLGDWPGAADTTEQPDTAPWPDTTEPPDATG